MEAITGVAAHPNKNPAICGGVQSGRSLAAFGKALDQAGMRSSASCGSRST
jgi:hypothetical protein